MHMRKTAMAGALALIGTLAACDDFLTDPSVTDDPNRPSQASLAQLYQGIQVNQFVFQTGDIARISAMWTQQMSGVGRQQQDRGVYNVGEDDFVADWARVYAGGGLIDMRDLIEKAGDDRTYAGITKVWEGLTIGTAASLWGDIPYSEAGGDVTQPVLDDQAAVYAAVQARLDEAIADLQSGAGAGPGNLDFVYGGDRALWIQAAYTLKARFYMHWVESQAAGSALATTACGGNCLTKAVAAAENGISSPDNDFTTYHSSTAGEQNLWWQFMNVARVGDMAAGERLVELMKDRNDPRLTEYFQPVGGEILGAPPGIETAASGLAANGRGKDNYRQPVITYAETELILAEAKARLGQDGPALQNLNNEREAAGLDPLVGLVGPALLTEIALEKYIALFQQIEVWNDHKRLCQPSLVPAAGADALPGRLYYSSSERNANPNIPVPGEITQRNDNDPNACPVP